MLGDAIRNQNATYHHLPGEPAGIPIPVAGIPSLLKIGTAIFLRPWRPEFTSWKVEAGRTGVTARLGSLVRDNALRIPVRDIAANDGAEVQVSVQYRVNGKEQAPMLVRSDLPGPVLSIATTSLFPLIVGNFGYAAMRAVWFVRTLGYFLFSTFILPEIRGRTLEDIEADFAK